VTLEFDEHSKAKIRKIAALEWVDDIRLCYLR